MSIFLFIFTWCWTVIMIRAWQGNIHWCELHYLRDGSRIEKAYIEKGRSGVNNSWQVQCQWGHQIGTETSFLCFHPSQCHRLEGDAFSVSAVRLLNVMRSAFALALALADMLCQLSGSYGMPRGIWHPCLYTSWKLASQLRALEFRVRMSVPIPIILSCYAPDSYATDLQNQYVSMKCFRKK